MNRMNRTLVATLFALLPGRVLPAQTDGTSHMAVPFLDLPLRELGESFADPDYGFEFRLPIGFAMVEHIEQLRSENILPESKRTASDGTVQRVQLYYFRELGGAGDANILIRANEPALSIKTAVDLRAYFADPDNAKGIPTRDVGRLYQFKMRGGDVGFFAQREFGNQASGGQLIAGQFMAYIRTGTRSLLVQFTAPKDRLAEYADAFKASLGSFILRDNPNRAGLKRVKVESKGFGGFFTAPVLLNLALAAVLVALFVRFLRGAPPRTRGA